MACSGCANSVESALKNLKGLESAEILLKEGKAKVSYDENTLSETDMAEAINEAGYEFNGIED